MRDQEIFDKVVAHARTMKKPSSNRDGCMYNKDGNQCFIGCLNPELFGRYNYYAANAIHSLYRNNIEIHNFLGEGLDPRFLAALQLLHDCKANWTSDGFIMQRLEDFAANWDLKYE